MIVKKTRINILKNGILEGEKVVKYEKQFKDLENLFESIDELQKKANEIAYTVYSYTDGDQTNDYNLSWGLTVMKPTTINDECNMTRGHFHANTNCAEFYFGVEGQGLLLFMDEFSTWAEEVIPGSLHHIDGKIAHRLVNTGDVDFKVGACWSIGAGYNYEAIEKKEFAYRIFKENDEIIFRKREK